MLKICKVAIVGAGYMASQHAQAFSGLPGAELVGVYSRSRERAAKLAADYPEMAVFDSVDELFERTQADIVVVAVSELSVKAVAYECFEYPWVVLLEKPAGYDLSDAASILQAARVKLGRIFVALNRRCYSSTRIVAERLNKLAAPRFIKVQDQEDSVEARRVGKPNSIVENWMYANAIHVIDYFRVFGRGRIAKVTPVVAWNAKSPWIVVAHLEFDSGDVGIYEAIWNAPGPWAVTVNAGDERYELRPLEQAAVQLNGQRQLAPLPADSIDRDYKPGLRFQAEQALRATRGEQSVLANIEDAFESMRLVAQIYGRAS